MQSDYLTTINTHSARSNGTHLGNGGGSTPNAFMGCKAKFVPDDLKCDIASVVRAFEFVNAADDHLPGGNCMLRARIGHAVLTECGLASRVVCGSLLYRVGKHRTRYTLRFCLPDNTGGFYEGYACAHVWIEVDDDIVDFSSSHWVAEAQLLYETTTDPADASWGRWSGASCRQNLSGNRSISSSHLGVHADSRRLGRCGTARGGLAVPRITAFTTR